MMDVGSNVEPTEIAKKSAVVTVTATDGVAPDWITFSMAAKYSAGGKQNKDELIFDYKAGEFEVRFTLVDNSTCALAFIPCFKETMWVQIGGNCPPAGPGDGGGVITPVSWSKNELVVINSNAFPETLTFMLRFDGKPKNEKNPPFDYDPKIVNGGNGLIRDS